MGSGLIRQTQTAPSARVQRPELLRQIAHLPLQVFDQLFERNDPPSEVRGPSAGGFDAEFGRPFTLTDRRTALGDRVRWRRRVGLGTIA